MQDNFSQALALVLKEEGGYSNDKHDKGGATNYGVIQREYNSYRRLKGEAPRSVKLIEQSEYEDIYKNLYWDKIWGDKLPSGLDYAVMDYAVNSGPSRAIKDLQKVVNKIAKRNIEVDGNIGSATLDAITDIEDMDQLVAAYCDARMSFLKALGDWRYFGPGWGPRVKRVKAAARGMVDHEAPKQDKPEVPNLGPAADAPTAPSPTTTVSIGAIVTAMAAGIAQNLSNPFALVGLALVLGIAAYAAYRKWA